MTVQDHRRVPASLFWVRIAALEPFLELVSKFIEISTKFKDQYPNRNLFRNFENPSAHKQKLLIKFYSPSKIHPSRVTQSLY